MLKILIAVDGSEHANRAIEAVGKMARSSLDMQAILLCVRTGAILEPVFSADYNMSTVKKLDEEQERLQTATLANAEELAKRLGIQRFESVRSYGAIPNEIGRVAKERMVDQIVMGTRGMGAVASMLLGSVTQKVLHLVEVPVLLVK